jgi:hypothetical protein
VRVDLITLHRVARLRRLRLEIERALVRNGCSIDGPIEPRHRALSNLLDQVLAAIDRGASA